MIEGGVDDGILEGCAVTEAAICRHLAGGWLEGSKGYYRGQIDSLLITAICDLGCNTHLKMEDENAFL